MRWTCSSASSSSCVPQRRRPSGVHLGRGQVRALGRLRRLLDSSNGVRLEVFVLVGVPALYPFSLDFAGHSRWQVTTVGAVAAEPAGPTAATSGQPGSAWTVLVLGATRGASGLLSLRAAISMGQGNDAGAILREVITPERRPGCGRTCEGKGRACLPSRRRCWPGLGLHHRPRRPRTARGRAWRAAGTGVVA